MWLYVNIVLCFYEFFFKYIYGALVHAPLHQLFLSWTNPRHKTRIYLYLNPCTTATFFLFFYVYQEKMCKWIIFLLGWIEKV